MEVYVQSQLINSSMKTWRSYREFLEVYASGAIPSDWVDPDFTFRDCAPQVTSVWRTLCMYERLNASYAERLSLIRAISDKSATWVPHTGVRPPPKLESVRPGVTEPTFTSIGGPRPSQIVSTMDWAPFPKIPNVRGFKVETGGIDELFSAFGIRKRVASRFEFTYYENAGALRYLAFTILKLRSTKSHRLY